MLYHKSYFPLLKKAKKDKKIRERRDITIADTYEIVRFML